MARALHRQLPRHLVIRRERGVGAHAVMLELARRSLEGQYPHLSNAQFIRMDCRYVAPEDFRELLHLVLSSAESNPDLIICLDGFGKFLADGQSQLRSSVLSLVAKTSCRIVGIVSPQEYDEYFAGRQDIEEVFSHLEILEPSLKSAEKLTKHAANGLVQQYGFSIEDAVIHRAVVLSDNYIPNSRLPSKAIRVLRDVCDDLAFEQLQGKVERNRIDESDIVKRVSEISGIPEETLAGMPDGVNYLEVLGDRIIGQDHVLEEVSTELGLIRAGMVDAGKPASVMLFVGQTGTGKTELAKQVAQLYSASKRLKTFTLGNYSEPHSVSGIIGVPAGYVGHDQGGRLVNELNADPYSCLLYTSDAADE